MNYVEFFKRNFPKEKVISGLKLAGTVLLGLTPLGFTGCTPYNPPVYIDKSEEKESRDNELREASQKYEDELQSWAKEHNWNELDPNTVTGIVRRKWEGTYAPCSQTKYGYSLKAGVPVEFVPGDRPTSLLALRTDDKWVKTEYSGYKKPGYYRYSVPGDTIVEIDSLWERTPSLSWLTLNEGDLWRLR